MRRTRMVALALLALLAGGQLAPARAAAQESICFAETGQCLGGRFRAYWEQNGGLAVFGFPLAAAAEQRNRDTGQTYLTQVFERARFELHAENAAPHDVQLGRLGDDQLRSRGEIWREGPAPPAPGPDCLAFDTGRAVCDFERDEAGARVRVGFRSFWESHGLLDPKLDRYGRSLALFGKPLAAARFEINSSGDYVLAQQFERARFEWSFERDALSLGRLGYELHSNAYPPKVVAWSGAGARLIAADERGLVWATTTFNQAGREYHTFYAAGPDGAALGAFGVAYDGMEALALDTTFAYWTNETGLWRLARAGGGATPEIVAEDQRAGPLAVDADGAYWANASGQLKAAAKAGGPPRILARAQGEILALAADPSFVYWVTEAGAVKRVAKQGGAEQTLLKDLSRLRDAHLALAPDRLAVGYETYRQAQPAVVAVAAKDGGGLRELAPGRPLGGLAATPDGVFWADVSGQITYAAFDALAPRVVVTGQYFPAGLQTAGRALYWRNLSGSAMRADLDS